MKFSVESITFDTAYRHTISMTMTMNKSHRGVSGNATKTIIRYFYIDKINNEYVCVCVILMIQKNRNSFSKILVYTN